MPLDMCSNTAVLVSSTVPLPKGVLTRPAAGAGAPDWSPLSGSASSFPRDIAFVLARIRYFMVVSSFSRLLDSTLENMVRTVEAQNDASAFSRSCTHDDRRIKQRR